MGILGWDREASIAKLRRCSIQVNSEVVNTSMGALKPAC